MSRKFSAGLLVALFLFIILPYSNETSAKRLLPQSQKTESKVKVTRGVTVSVKFRSDRNAIIATFTNLGIAKNVDYTLSYKTGGGIEQAAQSSIDVSEAEPVVRELPFGTCSTDNVCRYDTGITNAKLVVTTTLKNGRKVVKTFNLKVKK